MSMGIGFFGSRRFLSNFYPSKVMGYDGEYYPSVEHAFQAAKTDNKSDKRDIQRALTPGEAKKLGRNVKLRDDWEDIKLDVMFCLLKEKFSDSELKEKLLNTGNEELVEHNHWNDTYWGMCQGVGQNHLGKLLMKLRAELR